jgi:thiamine pyrophosphate-dependent acetolactate synthase large subunit-like protein
MARAAGYAATFSFDNLEDLATGIGEVMASRGPVFVRLAITPQVENTPVQFRPRARRNTLIAIKELPKAIASR